MLDAWKNFERKVCKELRAIVGGFDGSASPSSTGRVGHITYLGVDGLVGNAATTRLCIEAKRRKLPTTFLKFLLQVSKVAADFDSQPVLAFSLASDLGRKQVVEVDGQAVKPPKVWVMIDFEFFKDLLEKAIQ